MAIEDRLRNENLSYRDELSDAEKPIWDKACVLFEKMLDDFNSENLLRKGTISVDRARLGQIWENSMNFEIAFNDMVGKFRNEESISAFIKGADLTQTSATYVFLSQLIGTALINLEAVFRTSLLFFLEEEQGITRTMTLGQLLRQIKIISPEIGACLEEMVDTKIRNPLAHGTFWFKKGGKVCLATNSYLEEVEEMSLAEFWIETKKMNIIAIALIEVLKKKIDANYFRL
jgi:hypothetical protein